MRRIVVFAWALPFLFLSDSLPLSAPSARAATPGLLNFQGVLKGADGKPVPDGTWILFFGLWNGPDTPTIEVDEPHTFSGSTIALTHANIVPDSETVRRADNSIVYARGTRYTVDNATGVITRTSATAIPDGTAVIVTYRWNATSAWAESRNVPVKNGLFSVVLGENFPIPASALTGNDWIGVEVYRNSSWEALSPRVRLGGAAYALESAITDTINGASGGTINGSVSATGQVSGVASSLRIGTFTLHFAGIQGTGITSASGDVAGVRAVGANSGTGLALQVDGKAAMNGPLFAQGFLRPDFDSGVQTLQPGANATYNLTSIFGQDVSGAFVDAKEVVDATDSSERTYVEPQNFRVRLTERYTDHTSSLAVMWNVPGPNYAIKYRVRVWKQPQ